MTKLIIKGRSDFDSRWLRDSIYLDGKKIGRIGFGETLELEVKPGNHDLYGKFIWYKSKTTTFLIQENKRKKFKISLYKYQKILLPILLIILFIYSFSRINYSLNLSFVLILGVLVFAYPFYFLTIGKNRYLRIIELL